MCDMVEFTCKLMSSCAVFVFLQVVIFILILKKEKPIIWACVYFTCENFKWHMWNLTFSTRKRWNTSSFFWFWWKVPSWPHLEASAGTRFGQIRLLVAAWLAALTRMKHSSCEVADWRINKDGVQSGHSYVQQSGGVLLAGVPLEYREVLFVTLNRGPTFQLRLKKNPVCSRSSQPVCTHLTQPLEEPCLIILNFTVQIWRRVLRNVAHADQISGPLYCRSKDDTSKFS